MPLFNCNGTLLDLSSPKVMGILNLTPDSFFDGGKFTTDEKYLNHVERMIGEGAAIIDAGGQSTRPKAEMISEEEELKRVISPIEKIKKHFPGVIISVDTFRSRVAKEAVAAGASMINDISAGSMDDQMFDTVASLKVPYILMHMQGTPADMQVDPHYEDVFNEVFQFFKEKISLLHQKRIYDIILDPGFGFGKTVEHNFTLLKRLSDFHLFDLPVMVGLSRKSLINKVLHTKPEDALNGTTSLHTLALQNGAKLLRVHDVKEAIQTIQLTEQYHAAL